MVEAIAALPSYTARTLQSLGLTRARDTGGVKAKAVELKAIMMTRDHDYLDQVDFRICTHPGVLLLELPAAPSECIPRVHAFLTSPLYKRCRHATVRLRGDSAFVQAKHGGPVEEVHYFDASDPVSG